jgi:ClpP class serine protease
MADGRVFMGREAISAGLADEIRNFDGIIDESLTYSFLKGDSMLGGKKVKDVTVEELKTENPEVYQSIVDIGKEEVKKELEETTRVEKENQEKVTKIRNFAAKLNQLELAETLISEGKSVTDAFESLANAAKANETKLETAFEQTAPASAGNAGQDMGAEDEPKNKQQAMEFVRKRDDCSKAEAWKKARREFTSLFIINQTVETVEA